MKRRLFMLLGAVSLFSTGCCCDWCNWCNPCQSGCQPCGMGYNPPPTGAYAVPGAPVVGAVAPPVTTTYLPGPYYPVTAAAPPLESLSTY
ncbi:MAG: hypothetical protein ACKV0T_11385 [Planctomycetales bacterium]